MEAHIDVMVANTSGARGRSSDELVLGLGLGTDVDVPITGRPTLVGIKRKLLGDLYPRGKRHSDDATRGRGEKRAETRRRAKGSGTKHQDSPRAGFDGTTLKVIRTSVDRPDISVVVQPLLRGFIRDHRRLEFLLEKADPANVESLDKTITYVDSKAMLQAVRHHLIQYLVTQRGFARREAKHNIVRYDADVRTADKERIYGEFSRVGSRSRVAIVTIAFGMGLHIPDVRTVVQYGLPIEPSVTDLWQRLGRAMRKIPGQGTAYIFAPYWLFDHLGTDDKPAPLPTRGRRQAHRPVVPSRLREVALIEADSNNIDAGATSEPSEADSTATHDSHTEQTKSTPEYRDFSLFGASKVK
ncbi:hypothetical protein F4861DRAFT_544392 [Xylaria intraflava]|nr:hypothetical protein F4861DRAFT_544392 [Xylaria intraflava]